MKQEPNTASQDEWMKASDLAAYLRCTVRTVQNWKTEGLIPYCRIGGRSLRFKKSAVDAALSSRTHRTHILN